MARESYVLMNRFSFKYIMTYSIRQMDVRPLQENVANHVTVTVLDQCHLNVTPQASARVRTNTKVNNAGTETA